jgi:hypothetical protein
MIFPFENGRMLLVTEQGADRLCLAAGIDLSKNCEDTSPEDMKKFRVIREELFGMVMGNTIKETEHFLPRAPVNSHECGTVERDSGLYVVDPAYKQEVPINSETPDNGTKIPVFLYDKVPSPGEGLREDRVDYSPMKRILPPGVEIVTFGTSAAVVSAPGITDADIPF